MSFLQRWPVALATLCVLTCSACAPAIDSGSFVDRAVNFSRYRSYSWATTANRVEGPLARDANFADRFEGEVDRQLAAKGFSGPTSRRPDVLLRYRAAVTPRLDVRSDGRGSGSCVTAFECETSIAETDTATLVLDILDGRSK